MKTPQVPHPEGTAFALPAFATTGCARTQTPLQKFKSKVKLDTRMTLVGYSTKNGPSGHRYANVQRVVVFVGAREFGLAPDDGGRDVSYCDWPKASELTWVADDKAWLKSHGVELLYRFGAL